MNNVIVKMRIAKAKLADNPTSNTQLGTGNTIITMIVINPTDRRIVELLPPEKIDFNESVVVSLARAD